MASRSFRFLFANEIEEATKVFELDGRSGKKVFLRIKLVFKVLCWTAMLFEHAIDDSKLLTHHHQERTYVC